MTMNEETPLSHLEEQALKRQEKIKLLKRKRDEAASNENTNNQSEASSLPTPKFRSYKPQDKGFDENVLKTPENAKVESQVKDLLDLAKSEMVIDQLDIATLAPRKPDWDLKRDVAKKLDKLERQTQRAMAELIRDKLKEKQDLADIANTNQDIYEP